MCFEKTDLIVFGILEREGITFEVEFFSRDDAVRCAGCAEKITKILSRSQSESYFPAMKTTVRAGYSNAIESEVYLGKIERCKQSDRSF